MTVWPARAAAAIVLGLALSPIAASAPSTAAAGLPAPVSVTMIAALTVPEHTTGFIDPTLLESYTSEFGLLTRQLDQVIDRPIVLGIDPSIIASIRVLGTDAPASAVAWLDRLDAATNETFPLAWADADLTLPLQAGSDAVLAPQSFAFAIDASLFSGAAPDPTPTPEATEEPGTVPSLPTDESLVAWDYTVPEISWPAMNSVTTSDLETLSTTFGTTILSSGNIGATGTSNALTLIGDATALVADDTLSTLFDTTVSAGSGLDWETAMANLAASVSAVGSTEDKPASVLLALDRSVAISDPDLSLTIDAIAGTPNVLVTGLTELLTTGPVPASLVDQKHDEGAISEVRSLLEQEAADGEFARIAQDPTLITSDRRLDLLATLSNSWSDNTVGWTAALRSYATDSVKLRDSVKIVKSSSITLWADRASLPVTVSNDLNQPITVYVTVRPLTPLLKVENAFVEVVVEPKSQRKASVPVQSLSNGVVELEVTLHRSTGDSIGDTKYVRTTVQAGWETPFTITAGAIVVLVFAAGIVRTVVRRRRARTSEG